MQKFGVREICEVVLKAKAPMKVGNKVFYRNEPVIYFDTLKTSSLEGATTSVYAQGGRGNARLVAWEGDRTVTFTMEDALISPEGFMILSGAGLIEASEKKVIYQHVVETIDEFTVLGNKLTFELSKIAYLPTDGNDNFAYVMLVDNLNGEMSEPFIPKHGVSGKSLSVEGHDDYVSAGNNYIISLGDEDETMETKYSKASHHLLVDYYTPRTSNTKQIDITPDSFGGNFYLEASTLFRDTNGVDLPAEFIIPNCKIQSNFTFSMAASGDPSTFTFTMDAFPDYTRFCHAKKVLAAIQIIDDVNDAKMHRTQTVHDAAHDEKLVK